MYPEFFPVPEIDDTEELEECFCCNEKMSKENLIQILDAEMNTRLACSTCINHPDSDEGEWINKGGVWIFKNERYVKYDKEYKERVVNFSLIKKGGQHEAITINV